MENILSPEVLKVHSNVSNMNELLHKMHQKY